MLKPLNIEKTNRTPKVALDAEKGSITIIGRSIPENTLFFYAPILQWIDDYVQKPLPLTQIRIELDYFNTSSTKCMLDALKKFEILVTNGLEVKITWYYEEGDEDICDTGEDYKSILKIPSFEIISVKGEDE